jgi:flagellar biosynthesis protein FlhG
MDQATKLRRLVSFEGEKMRRQSTTSLPLIPGGGGPLVLAVTSGKGGVGKTNVVGNLAIACQRMGKKVLIFDADLGLANLDVIFGLHPKHTIEETIRGERSLTEILVKGPEGVAIIPACSGVQELAHLTEGQKLNLLNEFEALDQGFDIVLVDTGAGISSNVIFFNVAAEERIIVVTPEPTSMTDAYALIKILFCQQKIDRFILLSNMVKDENQGKGVYDNLTRVIGRFMKGVSIDYAGYIPWDEFLPKAVNRREPVITCYPDGSSSQRFRALADFVVQHADMRLSRATPKLFWQTLMGTTTVTK